MMHRLLPAVLFLSLATPATFAQYRGGMRGGGRGGFGGGHGFHRGFATPGIRSGGHHFSPRFGFRGPYGGFGYRHSYPAFVGGGFSYGWPYYGSGWYGSAWSGYPAYSAYYPPQPPPVTIVYLGDPYRTEPVGPVIINRSYEPESARPPVVRSYPESRPAERREGPPLYLIARKDDSIVAAIAYWVDGDTLHYVDRKREQKRISLDDVDRALSQQLNRERRVEFYLPP